MESIDIQQAHPKDAFALSELGRTTFFDTFAKDNTPQDMAMYLEKTFSEKLQAQEIADPRRRIFLAWSGQDAVGFYQLHESTPDQSVQSKSSIELLRLYVDKNYLRKGLGTKLLLHSFDMAHQAGFEIMWLGVWEKNLRAQQFYEAHAFKRVGSHVFQLGHDIQTDLILQRKIS